jgi:hypothetical protein
VTVPSHTLAALREKGFVEEPHPGIYIQTLPRLYSDIFGLDLYRDALAPEDLIY